MRSSEQPASPPGHHKAVAAWLLLCCALIFAMVILGGVTRLTHSGLSMVEWKPVTGFLPPLDEAEWQSAFDKYRQYPEYKKINFSMTLGEFKSIYVLEYGHRLLGRLIGIIFLFPMVFFVWRGWVGRRLLPKLVAMFVLGGLQGVLGWYMVKSGLVDRPDVSHFRLSAHLIAAFAVYGFIFWVALDLLAVTRSRIRAGPSPILPMPLGRAVSLSRFARIIVAGIVVTVLSGALVAGLDAGFHYNTFPLMNEWFVPPEAFGRNPLFSDLLNNPVTVQFDHRILAEALFAAIVGFWFWARRAGLGGAGRWAVHGLGAAALLQVGLGVSTLVLVVPVPLAVAHQAGALILFTAALWAAHEMNSQLAQVRQGGAGVRRDHDPVPDPANIGPKGKAALHPPRTQPLAPVRPPVEPPGFKDLPGERFGFLETADGVSIRHAAWTPRGAAVKGTVILLSGRSEFIEKYLETVSDLLDRGFEVRTLDWRGQGLSDRSLANRRKGHVTDYQGYVDDLSAFMEQQVVGKSPAPLYFLAHSMGAHVALRYLHDNPGRMDAAVLCAPLLGFSAAMPTLLLFRAACRAAVLAGFAGSYPPGAGDAAPGRDRFLNNYLTSDFDRYMVEDRSVEENPLLGVGCPTIGWLDATLRSLALVHTPGYPESMETPILMFGGGLDRIVSTEAVRLYRGRLPQGRFHIFPESLHEILCERDHIRGGFWRAFDAFLAEG